MLAGAARQASGGPWQQLRTGGLAEPRFLRVVLPLAPWVFGSVAVAMVYVPGLVAGAHAGRHRLAGPPHGRTPGQPFMLNVNILSATMRAPIASIPLSQSSNSGPCSGR